LKDKISVSQKNWERQKEEVKFPSRIKELWHF